VAVIAAGAVFATAVSAGADAADVASTHGTAVVNPDGSITVTVEGTWAWTTHNTDCNTDRYGVGWQVGWNDENAPGNFLATLDGNDIYVGVAADGTYNSADNAVHYQSEAPRCGTFADPPGYNTGSWGPISHTYAPGTDPAEIHPCAVVYDGHLQDGKDPESGLKEQDAYATSTGAPGGKYADDNSVEKNGQTPEGNVCAAIEFDPDVAVVKTGPTTVTVGTAYTYDITATNTGVVDADDTTITDVIPANVDFVSASAPCTYDTGTRTVTCNVGTLEPGGDASVTITVMPLTPGVDIVNTAVVTPDDETPNDNTSTWTIPGVNVLPANANRPPDAPVVTPIVAAPTFTG
jgi:uncharacterized repeat protein (TIGR01451 family)